MAKTCSLGRSNRNAMSLTQATKSRNGQPTLRKLSGWPLLPCLLVKATLFVRRLVEHDSDRVIQHGSRVVIFNLSPIAKMPPQVTYLFSHPSEPGCISSHRAMVAWLKGRATLNVLLARTHHAQALHQRTCYVRGKNSHEGHKLLYFVTANLGQLSADLLIEPVVHHHVWLANHDADDHHHVQLLKAQRVRHDARHELCLPSLNHPSVGHGRQAYKKSHECGRSGADCAPVECARRTQLRAFSDSILPSHASAFHWSEKHSATEADHA